MDLAIFDLDGTLIESLNIWREIGYNFMVEHGIEPTQELEYKIKTMSFDKSADMLIDTYGLNYTKDQILDIWFLEVKNAYENKINIKKDALKYLQQLKSENVKMCIATACEKSLAEIVTKRLGIYEYLEFIVTVKEIGKDKHFPDIFLYCCDKLSVKVGDSVVFEDSIYAIKTAKDAGFTVVGIADCDKFEDNEAIREKSDIFIQSFSDMLKKQ